MLKVFVGMFFVLRTDFKKLFPRFYETNAKSRMYS